MKINKDDFMATVNDLLSGIENKGLVEEMSHVVFSNGYMMVYNDKIALNAPFPGDIDDNRVFGVVAKDLLAAIKGIKTKEMDFSVEDTFVIVSGGKISTSLPMYDGDKIEKIHNSLNIEKMLKKLSNIPDSFLAHLETCCNTASDNADNIKGLYCVYVNNDYMFATNGVCATLCNQPASDFDYEFFLNKNTIPEIVKFNPIEFFPNKNWVYFRNEFDIIMAVRLTDVSNVFPRNPHEKFPSTKIKDGFKFVDVSDELDSLIFFSEGKDKSDKIVNVDLSPKKAVLTSSSEKGAVAVEIDVENYKGDNMQFIINPSYLKPVISSNGFIFLTDKFLCIRTETTDHLIGYKVEN